MPQEDCLNLTTHKHTAKCVILVFYRPSCYVIIVILVFYGPSSYVIIVKRLQIITGSSH